MIVPMTASSQQTHLVNVTVIACKYGVGPFTGAEGVREEKSEGGHEQEVLHFKPFVRRKSRINSTVRAYAIRCDSYVTPPMCGEITRF